MIETNIWQLWENDMEEIVTMEKTNAMTNKWEIQRQRQTKKRMSYNKE